LKEESSPERDDLLENVLDELMPWYTNELKN
jgi:hypothetical protein